MSIIPEPDDQDTTVAILERPAPEPAQVTAAVAAGHALLPSLDARTLEQSHAGVCRATRRGDALHQGADD